MLRHLINIAARRIHNQVPEFGRRANISVRALIGKPSVSTCRNLIAAGLFFEATTAEKSLGSTKKQSSSRMTTNLEHLLASADQLFDQNQFQETLDELKRHEDQSLPDIKWRKARAMFKLANSENAPKTELIRGAFALVSEAVLADDSSSAAHKWMAILLDKNSELDGIKERIKQLETVKAHMNRSRELNPDDPTIYHMLASYSFSLADMAWYQRKIVSAIFASPPSGTYEEALENALLAEEKKANFYSPNLLLVGKCYLRLKDNTKAKEFLTRAANVKVLNEDDKSAKEEATTLLKSC